MTARKTIKPEPYLTSSGELGAQHIGEIISMTVRIGHSIDDPDRGIPAIVRGELRHVAHGPEGTNVTIAGLTDTTGSNEEFTADRIAAYVWVEPSS